MNRGSIAFIFYGELYWMLSYDDDNNNCDQNNVGTILPYDPACSLVDQVHQSFAVSQKHLGVAYLDAYILHSPLPKHADMMEVWTAMEDLQEKGKVSQLGINSCYDIVVLSKLYDKAKVKPTIIQNRFYSDTNFDAEIRTFCKDKDIKYQAYWVTAANSRLINDSKFVSFASGVLSMTPVQAYFKYLIDRHDIYILTGTTDESNMRQYLDILNLSSLHQSHIDYIHSIFKSI